MIITPEKLKALYRNFEDVNEEVLRYKLEAIEGAIRAYTNNSFQVRSVRALGYSKGNKLMLEDIPVFKVDDTIQISKPYANAGVYRVVNIENNTITIDKEIYEETVNLITLVKYPASIIQGAINVLEWDCFKRDKTGIASETISRHSISYQQYDGTNTISGYPSALFGFCEPFMRART